MPRTRAAKLGWVLLGVLLLATVAGCRDFWKTPTPTPTSTPAPDIPQEVVTALYAALDHLRLAHTGQAPPEDVRWSGLNTTPPLVTGVQSYEFEANGWRMAIHALLITGDASIYEITLTNPETTFRWTSKLTADYALLESNLDVAADVVVVRDIVLSHVKARYSDQAPAHGLTWIGKRTTPEGSVGQESCQFTANAWTMKVAYQLARADQVSYRVELRSLSNQFIWRGIVDPQGKVKEVRALR
ncbi:MAG: hypothetical protein AMJ93_10970 [Anaerolineae bacterium SM23_84]|nr:MAG: hypothetical protein AMJ93_10970 [Anaerolineae bacterium SM23_84]